jgi:hypothetical protein
MRPTVIRLIVGGALGIAFSVSLWLPGTVVFPEDAPIRHLSAPDVTSTMVVRAAPVAAPKKPPAPARRRVVVRPVYVPAVRTAPVRSIVRQSPSRSTPAPTPVTRTGPPARPRLTPLSTPRRIAKKAKRRNLGQDDRRDEARDRDSDHEDEDEDEESEHGRGDEGDEDDDDDEGGDDRDDG